MSKEDKVLRQGATFLVKQNSRLWAQYHQVTRYQIFDPVTNNVERVGNPPDWLFETVEEALPFACGRLVVKEIVIWMREN